MKTNIEYFNIATEHKEKMLDENYHKIVDKRVGFLLETSCPKFHSRSPCVVITGSGGTTHSLQTRGEEKFSVPLSLSY